MTGRRGQVAGDRRSHSIGLGARALVIITDSVPRDLVILPEIVKLTLLRTAYGLVLSWSAELAGWQLQSSVTPEANGVNVATPPVAADAQLTVTVPATSGSQVYRLQGLAAPPPAGSVVVTRAQSRPRDTEPKSKFTQSGRIDLEARATGLL